QTGVKKRAIFLINSDVKKMQEQEKQVVAQCFLAGSSPENEICRDEKDQSIVPNETIAVVGIISRINSTLGGKEVEGVNTCEDGLEVKWETCK
ncbi:hypothetical protein Ancab_039072, partial [Ancistrocladus abbreviatus]